VYGARASRARGALEPEKRPKKKGGWSVGTIKTDGYHNHCESGRDRKDTKEGNLRDSMG